MSNKRIFYATQALTLTPVSADGTKGDELIPGGIQSVGVNTNFNLEKIFQLGQLELYDSVENNPEVEVTINKVIDGTKPLFLITMGGTSDQTSQSLVGGQNNRVNMTLSVFKDTELGSSGTPEAVLSCTGLYASNFTYTFPTDGNATEEVTLVGTDKTWKKWADYPKSTGDGDTGRVWGTDVTSKGIARRWKFDYDSCSFPTGQGGMRDAVLSNVTVSMDLGREAIYTLGNYEPYLRYVNFPVEITTEITSIGTEGDFLDISSDTYSCTGTSSIVDHPIKFVICGTGTGDKLTIDLGDKNKLQSVNYTGGDTGGGNVEISYSFTTDNTFNMIASGTFSGTFGPTGNFPYSPTTDVVTASGDYEGQILSDKPWSYKNVVS
jgi:hypothetical protein